MSVAGNQKGAWAPADPGRSLQPQNKAAQDNQSHQILIPLAKGIQTKGIHTSAGWHVPIHADQPAVCDQNTAEQ